MAYQKARISSQGARINAARAGREEVAFMRESVLLAP
jgi:hypothetical protein